MHVFDLWTVSLFNMPCLQYIAPSESNRDTQELDEWDAYVRSGSVLPAHVLRALKQCHSVKPGTDPLSFPGKVNFPPS